MITKNFIRSNTYFDSVTLMMISSKLSVLDGVENAAVMMGSDYNKQLMADSGLLLPEYMDATPNDMIIGVIAATEEAAVAVQKAVEDALEEKNSQSTTGEIRSKTIDGACKRLQGANFAVISLPGRYAAREVEKALDQEMNVLLFSDNISIEDEVRLKDKAIGKGLLMMGPDCGTAIINGISLGFANKVNRGSIGIVAASGTGLQEVSVIVHKAGLGVSHAIGTGGRDLKPEVGGKMMLVGLEALNEDNETEVIVLVSKPPAVSVMKKILEASAKISKPIIACFLGGDPAILKDTNVMYAKTLEDAGVMATQIAKGEVASSAWTQDALIRLNTISDSEKGRYRSEQKYIRGLYSGGTLTYESMLLGKDVLDSLYSNIKMEGTNLLQNVEKSEGHTFLDLGDDYFTDGRPHPMIDPRLRLQRMESEIEDPEVAVILFDILLGFGSHEDPAGALLPAILKAKSMERSITFIATICGTEDDFQGFESQRSKLEEAGVFVMNSNAEASRLALMLVYGRN
jgi:succinyl-CoA synthetase alpha subunit